MGKVCLGQVKQKFGRKNLTCLASMCASSQLSWCNFWQIFGLANIFDPTSKPAQYLQTSCGVLDRLLENGLCWPTDHLQRVVDTDIYSHCHTAGWVFSGLLLQSHLLVNVDLWTDLSNDIGQSRVNAFFLSRCFMGWPELYFHSGQNILWSISKLVCGHCG